MRSNAVVIILIAIIIVLAIVRISVLINPSGREPEPTPAEFKPTPTPHIIYITPEPTSTPELTAAPTPTPAPTPEPQPNEFPKVALFNGEDIKAIQTKLYNLGYGVSIDGEFGPATGTAVKHFQLDYGLVADGEVGQNTAYALGFSLDPSVESIYYQADLEEISKSTTGDWIIYITLGNNRLSIFKREADGHWKFFASYAAATGSRVDRDHLTPLGVHVIYDNEAYTFTHGYYNYDYPSFYTDGSTAAACGEYGIHSTARDPNSGYYDDSVLGYYVTNGCTRVNVSIAKWIQDNCPKGTLVVVDDSSYTPA